MSVFSTQFSAATGGALVCNFLEIALRNALRGLRVFPVRSRTKEPHIKDYPDLATTDPEQ
jgi:hypothetical protein